MGGGDFQLCGNRLGKALHCSSMTQVRPIKTWLDEFGAEELGWPAQSPDLIPTEHLREELEQRLRARVPDLTNALLAEWTQIPTDTLQKVPPEEQRLLEPTKGGVLNSILMPMVFRMSNTLMVKCPLTFGLIVYLQLLWPLLMRVLDAADLRGCECVSVLLDALNTSVHKQNNKRPLKTTLLSLSLVIWHRFN